MSVSFLFLTSSLDKYILNPFSKSFNVIFFFSSAGLQKTLLLCAIFVFANIVSISLPKNLK